MTKSELIISLANSYPQLLARDAELTVKTILDAMADALAGGQRIEIRGFGSFTAKKRAQKTARNISKQKTIVIPEHYIPAFKPSKTFLNLVKSNIK